eukprot:gene1209-11299_t
MKLDRRTGSKRVTSHQRNKVFKKTKEHHKKMKKIAKRNPQLRKKLKKDPGIPNLWPYKQELLEQYAKDRDAKKQEEEEKKEKKKERKEKSKMSEMAKLALDAQTKGDEYSMKQQLLSSEEGDDSSFGFKDIKEDSISKSTKQKYYQEFKFVVEKSDVILFLLDARDPIGCRCPDLEKTIQSSNPNLKIVLVLNKIDLIPKEALQKWLKYLRQEHPTIAFKASTQNQKNNISRSKDLGPAENAPMELIKNEGCLGADSLIKLLKNYCRSEDIKRNITVGIIGYPNVGKSSVINSLKRTKSAKVGSTPGVTSKAQEFYLDKHIKLLDSPGIIFSSGQLDSDIILRNAIRIEKLSDPILPVVAIINRCRKEQLNQKYNIENFKSPEDFLNQLANKRGKIKKGGAPNIEETAKIILRDWNTGKIPFFTLPPKENKKDNLMTDDDNDEDWSEFDDAILNSNQLISLKDAFQNDYIPMVSSNPQQYMEEEEEEEEEDEDFEDYEEDDEEFDDDDILEEE